jgi:hypothetical protein
MLLWCFLLAAIPAAANSEPVCGALVRQENIQGANVYLVDQIWSGTRVAFSGIVKGPIVYVAYYNPQRWLTVAELNLQTEVVCRQSLNSRFGGWDSHNGTTLAMAEDGTIHLAANMHNAPLTLANTDTTGSIASLKLVHATSTDETMVTYPTFIRGVKGDLLFLYRSGRSANGKWFINRWTRGRWDRVGEILSDLSQRGQVSAYPSKFIQDATGIWHFAIVWRTKADASANVAVSYASTRDFHVFYGADGRHLSSPLTPESADTVERPGENAGLMNSASVILDNSNKPIVLYTRYGTAGRNAIIAARPQQHAWLIKEIAVARSRTAIAGGGTLESYPQFRINSDGTAADFYIAFPDEPGLRQRLDLANLAPTKIAPKVTAQPALPMLPLLRTLDIDGLVQPIPINSPVRDALQVDTVRGNLQWLAQASNRDQPRRCESDGKTGCSPPAMPLMLVISQPKN